MFTLIYNFYTYCKKKSEKKLTLVVVGLDNAGKTTLLNALQGHSEIETSPTFGFNSVSLKEGKFTLDFFDLGGGRNIRTVWKRYLAEVHGLIFVLDAADSPRFDEARLALDDVLKGSYALDKPLLIYANKQDLPTAASSAEVVKALGLVELKNNAFNVIPSTAKTPVGSPPDSRIQTGLKWLTSNIESQFAELGPRVRQEAQAYQEEEAKKKKEREERVRRQREERLRRQKEAEEAEAAEKEREAASKACPRMPIISPDGVNSSSVARDTQIDVIASLPGYSDASAPFSDATGKAEEGSLPLLTTENGYNDSGSSARGAATGSSAIAESDKSSNKASCSGATTASNANGAGSIDGVLRQAITQSFRQTGLGGAGNISQEGSSSLIRKGNNNSNSNNNNNNMNSSSTNSQTSGANLSIGARPPSGGRRHTSGTDLYAGSNSAPEAQPLIAVPLPVSLPPVSVPNQITSPKIDDMQSPVTFTDLGSQFSPIPNSLKASGFSSAAPGDVVGLDGTGGDSYLISNAAYAARPPSGFAPSSSLPPYQSSAASLPHLRPPAPEFSSAPPPSAPNEVRRSSFNGVGLLGGGIVSASSDFPLPSSSSTSAAIDRRPVSATTGTHSGPSRSLSGRAVSAASHSSKSLAPPPFGNPIIVGPPSLAEQGKSGSGLPPTAPPPSLGQEKSAGGSFFAMKSGVESSSSARGGGGGGGGSGGTGGTGAGSGSGSGRNSGEEEGNALLFGMAGGSTVEERLAQQPTTGGSRPPSSGRRSQTQALTLTQTQTQAPPVPSTSTAWEQDVAESSGGGMSHNTGYNGNNNNNNNNNSSSNSDRDSNSNNNSIGVANHKDGGGQVDDMEPSMAAEAGREGGRLGEGKGKGGGSGETFEMFDSKLIFGLANGAAHLSSNKVAPTASF